MNKASEYDTSINFILGAFSVLAIYEFYQGLSFMALLGLGFVALIFLVIFTLVYREHFSILAIERRKNMDRIKEIPSELIVPESKSVTLGKDKELGLNVQLPDNLRTRHIHILGATGSGKTESVILNLLKQDSQRGLGAIILDAKGDYSFIDELKSCVDPEKLKIFDLSDENSESFDPLALGTPLEAAQRLFASLNWSEEYYKSKALRVLQLLFTSHHERFDKNPTLLELNEYLESPQSLQAAIEIRTTPKAFEREFMELSGLRDQISQLSQGSLPKILSRNEIGLTTANSDQVIYFRLQSLLSPQLASTVGKLIINNINYLAGAAHKQAKKQQLIPVYLDEFAAFACPEFADLISKARSAGYALHFSHQSIGDLQGVSTGFLNQITDNSATKIVMRINDPDSADYMARTFGTVLTEKLTQKVSDVSDNQEAVVNGEGSLREAHQFRASPDHFKNLPTGQGSVLISHGRDGPRGASEVFDIRFPRLGQNT